MIIIENIAPVHGAYYEFDAMHKGEFLCHIKLRVPGLHNVLNALAALAASMYSARTPSLAVTDLMHSAVLTDVLSCSANIRALLL